MLKKVRAFSYKVRIARYELTIAWGKKNQNFELKKSVLQNVN